MRAKPTLVTFVLMLLLSVAPLVAAASPITVSCSATTGMTGSISFCQSGTVFIERREWSVDVEASAGPLAAGWIHGGLSSVDFNCFPTAGAFGSVCDFGVGPIDPGVYRLVAEFDVVHCASTCQWSVSVTLTPR